MFNKINVLSVQIENETFHHLVAYMNEPLLWFLPNICQSYTGWHIENQPQCDQHYDERNKYSVK